MPFFESVAEAIAAVEAGEVDVRFSGQGFNAQDVQPLLEVMKSSAVEGLWMRGNKLGDDGASLVSDMLRENVSVQELFLADNGVADAGAAALAQGLAVNKRLRRLDLGFNDIGDVGVTALAASLGVNKALRKLNLDNNKVGDTGATALGASLETNAVLQSLLLDTNNISDVGASALAGGLEGNHGLRALSLSDNIVGDVGVEAFAASLRVNRSLQKLRLWANTCTAKGGEALAAAVESNDVLMEINLPEGIPQRVKARIEAHVKVVEEQYQDFGAKSVALLQSNAKVRWGRAKLMVVGKGAAGKSSTIRTLLWQVPVEVHDSTIGVDLKLTRTRDWSERDADVADLDEQLAKAQAQAEVQAGKQAGAEAGGRSLAKRVSRRVSWRASRRVSRPLRRRSSPSALGTLAVVVEENEVAKSYSAELKARAEQDGGRAAADEVSFTIWDYGGQEVFYALHHLFLTANGVYIVVFDMRELLGRERFRGSLGRDAFEELDSVEGALATLRFWLDSIALHAPEAGFVLVGTYLDVVSRKEDLKAVDKQLKTLSVHRLENTERNKADGLWFFPVDNMDRSAAALERAQGIRDVVVARVKDTDYVRHEVPLRWALLLEKVLGDKAQNYLPLAAVQELALDLCGIDGEEVVREVLPFLHGLGVVVHLTATPALANIVVTRPQWLLDNLSRLICAPMHMEAHKDLLLDQRELPRTLRSDLADWEERGIATRPLLGWLWQGSDVAYLSALMQEMLLASPLPGGGLLVPSLLPPAPAEMLSGAGFDGGPLAYVQFAFLPKGVFQRFVTSMTALFGNDLVELRDVFADAALMLFDNVEVLLTTQDASKRVLIRFQQRDADADRIADRVNLLELSFGRIDDTFMKAKLQPQIFLSADGTDSDAACASLDTLVKAVSDGKEAVKSISKRPLQTAAFAYFFASSAGKGGTGTGTGGTGPQGPSSFDVFLSHDWGAQHATHEKVVRIARALEQRSITCWLDEDEMRGNVTRSMARGIEQSRGSLIFVTRAYADKVCTDDDEDDNCRDEFRFIRQVHKLGRMIPVVIDASMKDTASWRGDFGFLLGNRLYEDLCDPKDFDAAVDALATTIRATLNKK